MSLLLLGRSVVGGVQPLVSGPRHEPLGPLTPWTSLSALELGGSASLLELGGALSLLESASLLELGGAVSLLELGGSVSGGVQPLVSGPRQVPVFGDSPGSEVVGAAAASP